MPIVPIYDEINSSLRALKHRRRQAKANVVRGLSDVGLQDQELALQIHRGKATKDCITSDLGAFQMWEVPRLRERPL